MVLVSDRQNGTSFTANFNSRLTNAYIIALIIIAVCFSFIVSSSFSKDIPIDFKENIIVDTDPGIDDAVAIFTALGDQKSNIWGITCVRGNANVSNVILNALKILMVAGKKEVPVYPSFDLGLVETSPINNWFGDDGFGDIPFPYPLPSLSSNEMEHSASFLARTVRAYPGKLTVVSLGPLTNLALAIHLNPEFLTQAKRIIILGGSVKGFGNAAPGIEFNFFVDAWAAAVVLKQALTSGVVITLMPMETVMENELTNEWRWNTLAKIQNPVVEYLNQLEEKQQKLHASNEYHPFDLYAMSVALEQEIIKGSRKVYGFVETQGFRTVGALVVDYLNVSGNAANLEIIMDIETDMIKKIMSENLSNFK